MFSCMTLLGLGGSECDVMVAIMLRWCDASDSRASSGTAMKLGQKNKDVDSFVTKLEEEGQSEVKGGAKQVGVSVHVSTML